MNEDQNSRTSAEDVAKAAERAESAEEKAAKARERASRSTSDKVQEQAQTAEQRAHEAHQEAASVLEAAAQEHLAAAGTTSEGDLPPGVLEGLPVEPYTWAGHQYYRTTIPGDNFETNDLGRMMVYLRDVHSIDAPSRLTAQPEPDPNEGYLPVFDAYRNVIGYRRA